MNLADINDAPIYVGSRVTATWNGGRAFGRVTATEPAIVVDIEYTNPAGLLPPGPFTARPDYLRVIPNTLADLRADFAEMNANQASDNDVVQMLDDFLTRNGMATVLYAEQAPAEGFVVHTCNPRNPGQPLPFGRGQKLPRGTCARCDQLNDGDPPRAAHPAVQAAQHRRDVDEIRAREIRDHNCQTARCGPVCTYGQW